MSISKYSVYKESGADWVKFVPAHWEVCSLKRIVKMQSGESITAYEIEEVGEYPVFGGNGLRGYASRYTHDGFYALIGRQGALCGNINYGYDKFFASEHAVVVTPIKPVDVFWLGEMLRSMKLNQYSVSAAQPGLAVSSLQELTVAIPPYDEQVVIAGYLRAEIHKIDALTDEAQRSIELLKERRSALISAAVTGQIDMHNLAEAENHDIA